MSGLGASSRSALNPVRADRISNNYDHGQFDCNGLRPAVKADHLLTVSLFIDNDLRRRHRLGAGLSRLRSTSIRPDDNSTVICAITDHVPNPPLKKSKRQAPIVRFADQGLAASRS
jgi:hypothetical protein